MTLNSNEPRESLAPGVREIDAVVADAKIPHGTDDAHQGGGLFPGDDGLPVARPFPSRRQGAWSSPPAAPTAATGTGTCPSARSAAPAAPATASSSRPS